MNDKIFVDTNILVYAYDRSEPVKQARALKVLRRLAVSGAGVISTQVLAEFFVTVTRKISAPISLIDGERSIRNYLQSWQVVDMTGLIILEAIRGVRDYQFSFWDAQIWAAAKLNQIPIVFSEDFNSGAITEGIRFENPLTDTFRLEDWI